MDLRRLVDLCALVDHLDQRPDCPARAFAHAALDTALAEYAREAQEAADRRIAAVQSAKHEPKRGKK